MIYLQTSVGLELRGEDILISSLQSNFSGGVFTHFMRIEGFRLRKVDELRREIHAFFRTHGLSRENIVLGIPRKDLVLRYLDLPAEVADNLKQVVQYQVQSFEPTDEDRFYHDFLALRPNNGGKRLTVMLVMVRKKLLDEVLQFLSALGIRPVAVTGSSIGLSNLFLQNRKDSGNKTFILGDLGAAGFEILALHHGSLLYSRAGHKEGDRSWKDLILREADEAASKIRLGPEGMLEKIVLAGESADAACDEVKAALPDCQLIRDCIPVTVPIVNRPHIQEAAASLGLAYTGMVRHPSIKLNLLPSDKRVQKSLWAYVLAAVLSLVIVVLLGAIGYHRTAQSRTLERDLDREIKGLTASVEKVRGYERQTEALKKRIKSIEDLLNDRDMNLEVLRELTTKLPNDTFLRTYTWRDGTITINGLSASASDLIPELDKSPYLKNVVPRGVFYKDTATGKEGFTFEAKLEK
jgi:Tfp pilus assembly protein PilN